jgi:PAS domain-containing protein
MTIAPLSRTADPAGALALFDRHPAAMLQADAQGRVSWMNAAARAWLGADERHAPLTLGQLGIDPTDVGPTGGVFDATLACARSGPARCRIAAGAPSNGLQLLTLTQVDDLARAATRAGTLEELLDMVQDFGHLGVWERDAHTLAGRWDRHMFRFWGLDPDSATPEFGTAVQAIVPEDRAVFERAFQVSLRHAGVYAHRFRVRRPGGSMRRLHSQWVVKNGPDGRPARVQGVMTDETQAWEQAQSHDTALTQLRAALDLGRIAVWRHDLRSGRVHHSDTAYEVLGIDPPADGLSIEELHERIHPDDLPAVLASTEEALATNRPVDLEARYRRSDGQWRTVMTRRVHRRRPRHHRAT